MGKLSNLMNNKNNVGSQNPIENAMKMLLNPDENTKQIMDKVNSIAQGKSPKELEDLVVKMYQEKGLDINKVISMVNNFKIK